MRRLSSSIHMISPLMMKKRTVKGGATVKNNNLASKLWDKLQKPLPR